MSGLMKYTEDDLREAFYKGREQACLPDEKSTKVFIRPTFNGYLRELDGKEDPHANFKQRVDNLINDKDYDLKLWEDMKVSKDSQDKLNIIVKLNRINVATRQNLSMEYITEGACQHEVTIEEFLDEMLESISDNINY